MRRHYIMWEGLMAAGITDVDIWRVFVMRNENSAWLHNSKQLTWELDTASNNNLCRCWDCIGQCHWGNNVLCHQITNQFTFEVLFTICLPFINISTYLPNCCPTSSLIISNNCRRLVGLFLLQYPFSMKTRGKNEWNCKIFKYSFCHLFPRISIFLSWDF